MSHLGEFDLIARIRAQFLKDSCFRTVADGAAGGSVAGGSDAGSAGDAAVCSGGAAGGSSAGVPAAGSAGNDSEGVVGIGDDCAVIPQRSGVDTLVTTDLLIEDRHFLLSDISPEELGWKSAAVNISDIAAMGGRPVATFLSIALPPKLPLARLSSSAIPGSRLLGIAGGGESSEVAGGGESSEVACGVDVSGGPNGGSESDDGRAEWVDRFIAGFKELSSKFGVPLLGGDTSASPDKLFINVTVLGECPHGRAVLRSGARAGDLICVTGNLGDAAAGLKLILERKENADLDPSLRLGVQTDVPLSAKMAENALRGTLSSTPKCSGEEDAAVHMSSAEGFAGGITAPACSRETAEKVLIRRHYLPMPRVAEGRALAAVPGVHAMMDISDGIASDLRHILEASSGNGVSIGAEIDLGALPLSEELRQLCAERGWDANELAVSGGEDYELLFTIAPAALPAASRALDSVSVIGRVTEGGGIRWIGSEKEFKGFTHF